MSNLQTSIIDLNKLKIAKDLKGKITELFTEDQLLELAKNHALPHYVITNPLTKEELYLFNPTEITDWVSANCVKRNEVPKDETLKVFSFNTELHKVEPTDDIPNELLLIRNLYKLPLEILNTPPGVYFLCDGSEIVYVGQSVNVANRIADHLNESVKYFDGVYFIPCHLSHLLHLESSMIRYFKPKYNQTCGTASIRDKALFKSLCTDIQREVAQSA
jgi:hypothetical protein